MAVRKSAGRYTVEFELKGHRIFRRLPAGATKAQADEFQRKLRNNIVDQELLGLAPTVPLPTAIAEWLEEVVKGRKDERETKSKAKLVMQAVQGCALTKAGIVEAAGKVRRMARVKKGTSGPFAAATVNRRLSVLKATAKWAWKVKHWTPENLSPYVILEDKNKERVRRDTTTQAKVEAMIREAEGFEAKAYIALGGYGLMRGGEIMKAKPEDIIAGGLRLPDTKNGEPRVVPVLRELRPFLKALPLKTHRRTLYARFEAARDAVGLSGLTHHRLRASGATILLNAGIPIEIIAHILGNTVEVAKKHYAHVLNRTAARAMRKGFKPIKNPSAKRRTGVSP